MFGWLRNRRRRKILAQPFPAEWTEVLDKNVWQYRYLSDADQPKLRDAIRIFVAEKNWEGCGGIEMTDEVRVTIAAYACLLVLELGIDCYNHVLSILVYPDEFLVPEEPIAEGGLIPEDEGDRMGEAWHEGPVILSWADVLESGLHQGDGINVAIHEFAHQLDMLNHDADGIPQLESRAQLRRWHKVMTDEYEQLVRQSEAGRATLLDEYGATDMGEFFAVATECFFEKPGPLRRGHPKLYSILREYYHQDPAGRTARTA